MNALRKRHGFAATGMIELICYMSIATCISVGLTRAFKPVWKTGWFTTQEYDQRMYFLAMNQFLEDIRETSGRSILWPAIIPGDPAYDPIRKLPWFAIPSPDGSARKAYVCYYYAAASQSLIRLNYYSTNPLTPQPADMNDCNPADTPKPPKTICRGLLPPTAAEPLFQKDPDMTQVVICRFRIPKAGSPGAATVLVRSAAVRE